MGQIFQFTILITENVQHIIEIILGFFEPGLVYTPAIPILRRLRRAPTLRPAWAIVRSCLEKNKTKTTHRHTHKKHKPAFSQIIRISGIDTLFLNTLI